MAKTKKERQENVEQARGILQQLGAKAPPATAPPEQAPVQQVGNSKTPSGGEATVSQPNQPDDLSELVAKKQQAVETGEFEEARRLQTLIDEKMAGGETLAVEPPTQADAAPVAGDTQPKAVAPGGNAALPDPFLEECEFDAEEDAKTEPSFTDEDIRDRDAFEKKFKSGQKESMRAIRETRRRKLWMSYRNPDGTRKYRIFDGYCEDWLGHTRQWVSQGTKWLAATETIELAGLDITLTVDACKGLLTGRMTEAGGLLPVLKECQEDGLAFNQDNLREIVLRRADYNYWSKTAGPHKPAAKTYAAYKKDCLLVKKLGKGAYGVVEQAQRLEGDFAENLIKVCTEQKKMPVAEQLLKVVTGKALEDIVDRLATLAQEFADLEAKKNLLASHKKQIKEMLKEGGLAKIREEAKALQTELKKAGVIKPKQQKQSKGSRPEPGTGEEGDAGADAGAGEGEEAEPSEVRENVDTAIQSLDAALDCDWPEGNAELQAILKSAEEAEKKLGEIVGKAKEQLADAPVEPEAVLTSHG